MITFRPCTDKIYLKWSKQSAQYQLQQKIQTKWTRRLRRVKKENYDDKTIKCNEEEIKSFIFV